ncbi:hypothetical protein PILCRDRAFT_10302 [Piloderma croceum F 1598]|uniref:Uncharacterized protein n=1 Tax=Piloderma croceum (strain F 1598) TaxID=765440 RepID=A0A0C3F3X2_PILCF|nr:hypothetical protein PILCRDRAFT_10302 [Piloderma croceum F 1598]
MSQSVTSGGSSSRNSPEWSASSQSRQRQLRSNVPEIKDQALALASGNVKKLTSAKLFLLKHGYIPQEWECLLCDLALVLFQLAVTAKSTTAADGIKSVALILEALETDFHASHVADVVLNKLQNPIDQITNAASEVDRQQEGIRECSGAIHGAAEYITEQVDTAADAINEACTLVLKQVEDLGDIKDKLTVAATKASANPLSYAAIATSQLSPAHSSLLARGRELQWQIVLDAAPGMPADQGFSNLSEIDLLAKANTAFELMRVGKRNVPEGLRFVGTKKLARGSVVLDLNTMEVATWIRDKDVKNDFIKCFGSMSIVQNCEYKVLVQFVPTTVDTEDARNINCIESDSGLSQGVIQRMSWAKPLEKRHAIFTLEAKAVQSGRSYRNHNGAQNANDMDTTTTRALLILPKTVSGCTMFVEDVEATIVSLNALWISPMEASVSTCDKLNAMHKEHEYPYFVTEDISTWESTATALTLQTRERAPNADGWITVNCKGSNNNSGRCPEQQDITERGRQSWDLATSGHNRPSSRAPATRANCTPLGPGSSQQTITEAFNRVRSRSNSHASIHQPAPPPPNHSWVDDTEQQFAQNN